MTLAPPPNLEPRRTQDFVSELMQRAAAWLPSWNISSDETDFGRTLVEIAGRFNSEVAGFSQLSVMRVSAPDLRPSHAVRKASQACIFCLDSASFSNCK